MAYRRAFSWILRVSSVVIVLLLVYLALGALTNTTLSADVERREAAAEATLGNLSCRKEVRAAFPFFTLSCRDVRER